MDGTARLWESETGKSIGEPLKGHKYAVKSAAFSPDGKRIVTSSQVSTARLEISSGMFDLDLVFGFAAPASFDLAASGFRMRKAGWSPWMPESTTAHAILLQST